MNVVSEMNKECNPIFGKFVPDLRYLKTYLIIFSQSLNLEEPLTPLTQCCNLEILRQGGLVLFCDYVVS
jgi:hypothetical protein